MTTEILVRNLAPLSRMSVYRHLRALNIKPLGVRQRPQHWPDNAPELIRARLGGTSATAPAAKLTAITKLRAVRKQGRAKR